MVYFKVKLICGVLLSAIITVLFLRGHSLILVWAIVAIGIAQALAIRRFRSEIAESFLAQEAKASRPRPFDKLMWGIKPRLRDFALVCIPIGLFMLWIGYRQAEYAERPSRGFLRLVFDNMGNDALVAGTVALGVFVVIFGVEVAVGRQLAQR